MDDPESEASKIHREYYEGETEDSEDIESEEESSEDEKAFVVDAELDDCDAEEGSSQQGKLPFDAFLYDICNPPFYNDTETQDGEAIREEGLSDNEWEDSDDDHGDKEYGVHDPSVHWKLMKPHLGERFASQEELRFCFTNYAVRNGYPIKITKSSSERLQAKCGKDRRGNKCTFKLWVSWMNGEHSFQVKGLNETHTCVREYSHATLVNPTWIAKQFMKQLCQRPKMKAREMKEEIKKKFLCVVSKGQLL